ncbi:unnamed protein product [Lactuca virosa]|uniref:Uncharacterized protein n=1 Tax=Lactuca virosa TaxID=75947 RepID=A0AAU9LT68_9ASTR|nr:unnamed protein product [Lactuca virosa]
MHYNVKFANSPHLQTVQNTGVHHTTQILEEVAQTQLPHGPIQEGPTYSVSPNQKIPPNNNQNNNHIDLNSFPVSSNNVNPQLSQNHQKSQNNQHNGNSKSSSNTDEEVSQTVEIGEKIGFRVQGYEDQIRKIIKKRRVTIIDQ